VEHVPLFILVVRVVVLKIKIKNVKANGAAKYRFAVLKKTILVFVTNVNSFPVKFIPKN